MKSSAFQARLRLFVGSSRWTCPIASYPTIAQSCALPLVRRSDTIGDHPFAINAFNTSKSQLEICVRLYDLLTVVALSALKFCGRCNLKVSTQGRNPLRLTSAFGGNDDGPPADFPGAAVLPEPDDLSSVIRRSFWLDVPQPRYRKHNATKEIPTLNVRIG